MAVTIFTGAFLLFQVQPVTGKIILPWFGGSAGVWSACLLFFQGLLWFGYVYAHLLVSKFEPTRQGVVHASFLLLSLLVLPIALKPVAAGADSFLRVLIILGGSIGLP